MKILFLMPLWTAPSETWMQRMMECLGDELAVVATFDTGGATKWRGKLPAISLGPSFYRRPLQFFSILFNLAITFKKLDLESFSCSVLLKIIKKYKITHVFCHYGDFALKFKKVWESRDVKLYVHFHGYDATFDLWYDDHSAEYFCDNYKYDIIDLAKKATIICNSEYTVGLLTDIGVPRNRIFLKYLGVKIPDVTVTHKNKAEVVILHLGRLVDFKSPDRTIMAFEIAMSKGLRGRLVIAGDGPMRIVCELLRKRSLYAEKIQILGAVDSELACKLMLETDIFTQHNIKGEITRQVECFGVSIVEAMSLGLPVICTKSGGVLETVVDNQTGYLIDPGDVEAQADAFLKLAKNAHLRQSFGDAGHKRVAEHFSDQCERNRLFEILRS